MPETRDEPMAAAPAPGLAPAEIALARAGATLALAALAALLTAQTVGTTAAALGAALATAAVVAVVWRRWVLRPEGVSLGRAAAAGVLATLAAVSGAAIAGGAGAAVVVDQEARIALLFSVWIVMPVMVAAAVGLAASTRALARRPR